MLFGRCFDIRLDRLNKQSNPIQYVMVWLVNHVKLVISATVNATCDYATVKDIGAYLMHPAGSSGRTVFALKKILGTLPL